LKSRMVNWLKRHKKVAAIIATTTLTLVLMGLMLPVYAADTLTYPALTGTYDISSRAAPRYLDNTRHPRIQFGTLVITTQVQKAITDATLQHLGTDIALTGLVGTGKRPTITLHGTDSDGADVLIQGRVRLERGSYTVVTGLSGRMQASITSAGSRWDDSADGTAEISVVTANSAPISCLINGGTDANPKTLLFHNPANRLKLRHLSDLREGQLGFWFNLELAAGPGPQMMLRFAPADSTGSVNQSYWGGAGTSYVDITVMPYQAPYVGTGGWLECDLATAATTTAIYYGNDPTDFTAFGGAPIASIDLLEAAIDAEAAMIAGGDECGEWVLTMVSVELWEAGARTCYIDDVTIGGQLYTLEPNAYYARLKAIKQ